MVKIKDLPKIGPVIATQKPKLYRLYIDESGDHTYNNSDDPEKKYLGLTGCIFATSYYRNDFQPTFEKFKRDRFTYDPDDTVILHRKELINKQGHFSQLMDKSKEKNFNDGLLAIIENSKYTIVTVVIDKKSHKERYNEVAFHPYHYCLVALLERYCGFLHFHNVRGDVLAESRGGQEDMQLKEAYRRAYESGTNIRDASYFQQVLTSKEIKLKPKLANIAGLQLADLLAFPCKQDILLENKRIVKYYGKFGGRILDITKKKYNFRSYTGQVKGYGKVFLE